MAREQDIDAQQRALVRRVALGTLTIVAFMWALWDTFDVPVSVFVEALVGIGFMIVVAVAAGAGLGALLAWWRRSR